jgi:hypothetical protein
MACIQLLCHDNRKVIVFEDTFQRVRDRNTPPDPNQPFTHKGRQVIIQYNLSQHSLIENNQTNTMTASSIAPVIDTTPTPQPGFYEQLYDRTKEHLSNPLTLGAMACIGYLFYCAKTKLSLYSLGKACIEKAVWSLWKTKLNDDDPDEADTEAALLMQILQTYNTDNYTQAVARFLHDVEEEIDVLTAYINEAQSVQDGLLRFIFKDMSTTIKEAQERLDKLLHIKSVVMTWLHRQQWEN